MLSLEGVHKLGLKLKECSSHLVYGKMLIKNYKNVFADEIAQMKSGNGLENELFIRNYEQGIRLLGAYYSIMLMIEKYLGDINLQELLRHSIQAENDAKTIKNRYAYLESRLEQIMALIG